MGPNHGYAEGGAPGTFPPLPTRAVAQARTVPQRDLKWVLAGRGTTPDGIVRLCQSSDRAGG